MIEMKKLRELVKLMKENDVCELDIRDENEHIVLKRPGQPEIQMQPMMAAPAPVAVPAAAPAAAPAPAEAAPPSAADQGLIEIKSPMVGTFYSASSPDSPPFVKPGDSIGPDNVVCIIEAMKVFNEIKAEVKGTIDKVLVENGEAVEFDQPIFLVKPA